jgi:hypothetical protein
MYGKKLMLKLIIEATKKFTKNTNKTKLPNILL